MSPLIGVEELSMDAAAGRVVETATRHPVRILDVRWRLDAPEGRPAYLAGHLPGAVYVDLEQELSWHGHPEQGRHPLPNRQAFARAVQRWGIDEGDLVVVYDDVDGVAAARAWWLLSQYGIRSRVLDGGLRAWISTGSLLERGDRTAAPGSVRLRPFRRDGVLTIDEAAMLPRTGILVDVRAPEHYRGLRVGADPVPGHIPGAINIPTTTHIAADGRFRAPARIKAMLSAHGVKGDVPVAVYCGSGIASAHSVLAYRLAGFRVAVFAGSWSLWSRSAGRPAALGAAPYGPIRTA